MSKRISGEIGSEESTLVANDATGALITIGLSGMAAGHGWQRRRGNRPLSAHPGSQQFPRAPLVAQDRALSDLAEIEVPSGTVLNAPVAASDNVDLHIENAFEFGIGSAKSRVVELTTTAEPCLHVPLRTHLETRRRLSHFTFRIEVTA